MSKKRERIVADELLVLADELGGDDCPALAEMFRSFAKPIVEAHDAGACECPEVT